MPRLRVAQVEGDSLAKNAALEAVRSELLDLATALVAVAQTTKAEQARQSRRFRR